MAASALTVLLWLFFECGLCRRPTGKLRFSSMGRPVAVPLLLLGVIRRLGKSRPVVRLAVWLRRALLARFFVMPHAAVGLMGFAPRRVGRRFRTRLIVRRAR